MTTSASSPDPGVSASVLVDGNEIPYRRAGHGQCVLLLLSASTSDGTSAAWFRELSRWLCVIAPHPPATHVMGSRQLAEWLLDVMDGLGLVSPAMVAERQFAHAARLALSVSEGAGPVVIVNAEFSRTQLGMVLRLVSDCDP